jgi:hypothetical protein
MWGTARWWTIKNIAKLGASGIWEVEVCSSIDITKHFRNLIIFQFTDVWLGYDLRRLLHPDRLTLLLQVISFAVLCIRFPTCTSLAVSMPASPIVPQLIVLK